MDNYITYSLDEYYYKKIRNEITADVRRAKATFFRQNIEAAKSTAAYWKVLSEATNPKRRPLIGPLKRDDNTLAVRDEEKANLMNTFFTTVGASLSRNSTCAPVEAEIDIAPVQYNQSLTFQFLKIRYLGKSRPLRLIRPRDLME